jgi:hypothetical protein
MKVSDTIGAGIGTDDAGQEEIDWFGKNHSSEEK